MFYFVNWGTFVCYVTGAVTVGGGSYSTWYFRDTISNTFSDTEASALAQSAQNPTTNNHIDKSFKDALKTAQDQQESISDTKEKISKSKAEKQTHQQFVGSLIKEGEDIQAELKEISVLLEKSDKKITDIRNNKTEQDKKEVEALQKYKNQKTKVDEIETNLLNAIKNKVDKAQTALTQAFDEKNKKTKALEYHLSEISIADTTIKKTQTLITQLTKQKENKLGAIDSHSSTKKSKEEEKTREETEIKRQISERIQTLGTEKTTLDGIMKNLDAEITQAQQKSTNLTREIQKINNTQTIDVDQKNKQKKQHEDQKDAQDKIVAEKLATQQAQQTKVNDNTKETNELTSLQSQTLPYTTITLTQSTIKNIIAVASEKIKNLNDEINAWTVKINALEGEKDDVVKMIDATQKIHDAAKPKKTELDNQTTTIEGQKQASENDYNAKNIQLESEQSQQSEKQKKLQQEKNTLNEQKNQHEQEEIKQTQLETELKIEEANQTELNAKKTIITSNLGNNKKRIAQEAENIKAKEAEIKVKEKSLENQQGIKNQP